MFEPQRRVSEPIRRALDAIILRWLAVYVVAASAAACPVLCAFDERLMPLCRAALPVFLVGFIGVHLVHRRRARRSDGWRRAFEADPGNARMAIIVGACGLAGVALSLASLFCPYESFVHALGIIGIWVPIFAPLYAVAVWVAVDCAGRRLARSADDADRSFRDYWRGVARR